MKTNNLSKIIMILLLVVIFSNTIYSTVMINGKNYNVSSEIKTDTSILSSVDIVIKSSNTTDTDYQIDLKYSSAWKIDKANAKIFFIFSKGEKDSDIVSLLSSYFSKNKTSLLSYCNDSSNPVQICKSGSSQIAFEEQKIIASNFDTSKKVTFGGSASTFPVYVKTAEINQYTHAYAVIYFYTNDSDSINITNPEYFEIIRLDFKNNLSDFILNSQVDKKIIKLIAATPENQNSINFESTTEDPLSNVIKIGNKTTYQLQDKKILVTLSLDSKFSEGHYIYSYIIYTKENEQIIEKDISDILKKYLSGDEITLGKGTGTKYNFEMPIESSSNNYFVMLFTKDRAENIYYTESYISAEVNTEPPQKYSIIKAPAIQEISYSSDDKEYLALKKIPENKAYDIYADGENLWTSLNLNDIFSNNSNYIRIFDYNPKNISEINNTIITAIDSASKNKTPVDFEIFNSKNYKFNLGQITKNNQKYILILTKGSDNNIYYTEIYLDVYKDKESIYNKKQFTIYKSLYYFFCTTCIEPSASNITIPKNSDEIVLNNSPVNITVLEKGEIEIPKKVEKTIPEVVISIPKTYNYEVIKTNNSRNCFEGDYPIMQDNTPFRCVCVTWRGRNYYGVEKCVSGKTVLYGPYNLVFSGSTEYILGEYPSPLKESCWKAGKTGCNTAETWKVN